mmetsp:Transcript_14787/g.37606  ORF Transcript_14787/g.37606 Transcript_14787/m.37606 type:complete len:163 (-) Transcript_14787:488-976(-)
MVRISATGEIVPDDRAPSPRQAKTSPTSSSLPNVPLPSPPMTIRRRVRREDKNEEGHSSIDPSSGVQLIPRESGFLGLPDVNVFGVRLQSLHVCIVIGAWMIIGWRAIFVALLLYTFTNRQAPTSAPVAHSRPNEDRKAKSSNDSAGGSKIFKGAGHKLGSK